MKIEFQRFGGIAPGLTNRAVRYSATLSGAEAEEVRQLLPPDFESLVSSAAPRRGPDAFRYEIVVEDGGSERRVTLSETDLPDSMRPLLDWLRVKARV